MASAGLRGQENTPEVTPEQKALVDAAIPGKAAAKPRKRRRMLVSNLSMRDGRLLAAAPMRCCRRKANYASDQMGKRTGAYEAVFSNDIEMFRPGKIEQFDALCFLNTVGVLFDDPELRKSLLGFIAGGKGFVGFRCHRDLRAISEIRSGRRSADGWAPRRMAGIRGMARR